MAKKKAKLFRKRGYTRVHPYMRDGEWVSAYWRKNPR